MERFKCFNMNILDESFIVYRSALVGVIRFQPLRSICEMCELTVSSSTWSRNIKVAALEPHVACLNSLDAPENSFKQVVNAATT